MRERDGGRGGVREDVLGFHEHFPQTSCEFHVDWVYTCCADTDEDFVWQRNLRDR